MKKRNFRFLSVKSVVNEDFPLRSGPTTDFADYTDREEKALVSWTPLSPALSPLLRRGERE
jgi:hypothetical protein